MEEITIICPSCRNRGSIEVSQDIFKNVSRGIVAININKGLICSHNFITYLDKTLSVRDSFLTDFSIELPDINLIEKRDDSIPELDFSLIDLPMKLLIFILRSIFFGHKVIIISEIREMIKDLNNLLQYVLRNSFNYDVSFLSSEDFQNKNNKFKNEIVLRDKEIIFDKNNVLGSYKIDVERKIIEQIYIENDLKMALFCLKNEISKAFIFSKIIEEYCQKNIKEDNIIFYKEVAPVINDKYNIKIGKSYFNFLIYIIKNYFKIKVKLPAEAVAEQLERQWGM